MRQQQGEYEQKLGALNKQFSELKSSAKRSSHQKEDQLHQKQEEIKKNRLELQELQAQLKKNQTEKQSIQDELAEERKKVEKSNKTFETRKKQELQSQKKQLKDQQSSEEEKWRRKVEESNRLLKQAKEEAKSYLVRSIPRQKELNKEYIRVLEKEGVKIQPTVKSRPYVGDIQSLSHDRLVEEKDKIDAINSSVLSQLRQLTESKAKSLDQITSDNTQVKKDFAELKKEHQKNKISLARTLEECVRLN